MPKISRLLSNAQAHSLRLRISSLLQDVDLPLGEQHKLHVYWRCPFDADIQDWNRVVEYRDDGPDKDFITDRRCVMDRSRVLVKAYCLLVVGIPTDETQSQKAA